jgi:hypothetical protein
MSRTFHSAGKSRAVQTRINSARRCRSIQQALNAKQKNEFCQTKEVDLKLKHKDPGMMAEKKFGMTPSDSQIICVLKRRADHLTFNEFSKDVNAFERQGGFIVLEYRLQLSELTSISKYKCACVPMAGYI